MLDDDFPYISVIMPVRDEGRFITDSLGAILSQDYPAEMVEILVADGMSRDDTIQQIQALVHAERVHILPNPLLRQSSALNLLLQQACGDVIIRVDGHTVVAPDYIRQCVTALKASAADEVGGAITPTGLTPVGVAIAAACRSAFAVPGAFHSGKKAQFVDTVYLGAWPREVLQRLGGYQECLRANEDYELNFRLRRAGGKIYFSPAIRSTYYGRQSLGALARQYLLYGRAKVAMLREHPTSLRWRHLVAPAFVGVLTLGGIDALMNTTVKWAWIMMLLMYVCLCLVFTVRAKKPREQGTWWIIPGAFLIIHLSWGLGFWIGLFERPTKMENRISSVAEAGG